MPTPLRVLIVDPVEETRWLIAAVLERAGEAPVGVGSVESAVEALRRRGADLVAVDLDDTPPLLVQNLAREAARQGAPVVTIGTNRPADPPLDSAPFVRKPYHYQQLMRTIRGTWGAHGAAPGQAAA